MIVFYFAEMGTIEHTDWMIHEPDWVNSDGRDKPMMVGRFHRRHGRKASMENNRAAVWPELPAVLAGRS